MQPLNDRAIAKTKKWKRKREKGEKKKRMELFKCSISIFDVYFDGKSSVGKCPPKALERDILWFIEGAVSTPPCFSV